ncbi:MAG: helix-turn-helix transcriptional regulator [Clostridia bacterium]|nr:helix-turn-helix transcriptional regulator [Clostridia bacterium]
MEKKTIGRFISALRRANGMTQRELGEKLYVSDKTVSRWECDECTPELSLIPVIADIFGITSDELLRGERNAPSPSPEADNREQRASQKSEKQLRVMLYNRMKRFKNLSLISLGLSIAALIAAMICDLAFSEGLIGMCLVSAFLAASQITLICFTVNTRLLLDEDDESFNEKITLHNSDSAKHAVNLTFLNLALFAFCLPIVLLTHGRGHFGLFFGAWVMYGAISVAVCMLMAYILYTVFIKHLLCREGIISVPSSEAELDRIKRRTLGKTSAVAAGIAAVAIFACWFAYQFGYDIIVRERVFNTCEEFKAFMESEYDEWKRLSDEGSLPKDFSVNINGEQVWVEHIPSEEYDPKETREIIDSDGNVICTYYCNPELYHRIDFNMDAPDRMPVRVITQQARHDAGQAVDIFVGFMIAIIIADTVCSTAFYTVFLIKLRRRES